MLREQAKIVRWQKKPENYFWGYNNPAAWRENNEVERLLLDTVNRGAWVLDLGCGTGYGYEVLGEHCGEYIGIDPEPKFIETAQQRFPGVDFIEQTAEQAIGKFSRLENVIALWSLNYMPPSIIFDIHQRLQGAFVAVHYNQTYLSGDSIFWYRGLKEYFECEHAVRQQEILDIFNLLGAETFKLLDEPYYYVSILRGRDRGK